MNHHQAAHSASLILKTDLQSTEDPSLETILKETYCLHQNAFYDAPVIMEAYAFAKDTLNDSVAYKIIRQGFSINAAKTGRYSAVVDGEVITSSETYPLLVFYDRRVAVRFQTRRRDLFIITDEYWGVPYLVYDANKDSFFDTGISTIPSRDGLLLFLASLHYFNNRFDAIPASTDRKGISLLIGGNNNIAHFFWNYFGGICAYASIKDRGSCTELLSISDCFNFDSSLINVLGCHRLIPLSGCDWQERLKRLAHNIQSCCHVRMSGFGLPAPVRELISIDSPPLTIQSSAKPTLTITIRSTNRQLVDQVSKFLTIANACNQCIDGGIQVIVDGPCLQSYSPSHHQAFPEYKVISILIKQLKMLGIQALTVAGMSLIDQIRLMRASDCVLTYFSGGNCKFTGIVDCPIIFLCPPCKVSEAHIRTFSQLPHFYASHNVEEYFHEYHFFMDPSYLVYPSNNIPYLTPSPNYVESVNYDLGLASDFSVATDHLIDLTISSLSYSLKLNRAKENHCR